MQGLPLHEISPGDELRVQLFGVCPCGARLDHSESEYEELGGVSLTRLVETTAEKARTAACPVCENRITEATVAVSYRLPGHGPFIVAEALANDNPEVELSIRSRAPIGPGDGYVSPLGASSELDAVSRLGTPLSVIAAWHEALMQIDLGVMERAFNAGPGLRLIATTAADRRHDFNLGRIPFFRDRIAEPYRERLQERQLFCYATIDVDAAVEVVAVLGASYGLVTAQTDPEHLAISRRNGEFAIGLDIRELLVQAAANCLTLPAAADPAIAFTAARLVAAEETKLLIERALGVDGRIDEGKVVFENEHGKALVDIDAYLEGTSDDQEVMLTQLRLKLGIR